MRADTRGSREALDCSSVSAEASASESASSPQNAHRLGRIRNTPPQAHNNMATVAEARGDLTEALRLHTRALDIKLRSAPAGRPSQTVADSHYNMAQLLARLGRLPEARAAAQQSLDITRALAGPCHPHTVEAAALVRQLAPGPGPTAARAAALQQRR